MQPQDTGITVIGAGNVATHLAKALVKQGFSIHQIYSRTLSRAILLSQQIAGSRAVDHLDFADSLARVFIIAVKDDAKHYVATHLQTPANGFVFHTSGTVQMTVLAATNRPHGIFYPLQTFVENKPLVFDQIPLLIEGSDASAMKMLEAIANTISNKVYKIDSAQRKQVHLAAVFASNFTNRMLATAEQLLSEVELPLNILQPLVNQSVQNVFEHGTDTTLTGPAQRKDRQTMNNHLEMLKKNEYLHQLYRLISDQIVASTKQ